MRILSTTLIVLACSSSTAIGQGNDTCSLAQPIAGEGTFAFDNFAATTDGLPDPICENAGQTQMDHDVWFVWTAPSSGSVTMSTCGLTTIDSWIAAYDGSACPTGAPLDCNDDTCGTQSQVSFAATAGSDYLLRVGSWAGAAGGTGSISLSLQVPIGNDDCASAEVISGEGLFPFDNTSATIDGVGDVLCTAAAAGQIEKDIWFRWTATFTGDAHVRTCNGASHDTQLAAYDLQACPPSGALVCNDDACSVQSAITFPVMNGSEYLLRVGVWQTSPGGSGDIEISENAGPSCASLVSGPDVVVGNLTEFSNWGTVGSRAAYSIGATACNFGDQEMPWQGNTAQHPVIAQNLYRVRDERIEQVGLSWVKHGFGSATENACCICQDPNNGQILGIGCADTYGSGTNGAREGLIPTDTRIGLIGHAGLTLGFVLLASMESVRADLLGYLFGDVLALNYTDVGIIALVAFSALGILAMIWKTLLADSVSPDILAAEHGETHGPRARGVLLMLVAGLIAFGLQIVGALLIVALLIIPAAAARPLARTPEGMALLAALIGAAAAPLGIFAAFAVDAPAGPSIVLAAASLFVVSNFNARLLKK